MDVMLVGVTGMPGSGKSVIARHISNITGWPVYSMGDIVREETMRRGRPLTAKSIEETAAELRKEKGMAAVAILLMEKLRREVEEGRVRGAVIDGMRGVDEARVLAGLGKLCVVAVHASPLERYRRLLARRRAGDVLSWEDFVLRDRSNLRFGIGELIALADYVIVNEDSLDEAYRQAERVAVKIVDGQGKGCSGGRY